MGKIKLIIWREFITRARKPSFLIMTILGPLLLVGGMVLVTFLGMQEGGIQNIVVVDKAHLLTNKLQESNDIKFFYEPDELSDSAFKASPYSAMVEVNPLVLENNTIQIFYKDLPSMTVQNYISREIEKVLETEKLRVNNVDPATYRRIKTALKIQLFDIEKQGKQSYDQIKAFLGFGFGYLIFFFIFMYGAQVMRGVMEEKQNRVVEVLISSVKPFQLMMGKIVGVAMVGLTQFLLWVVLTLVLGTVGMGFAKSAISGAAMQQTTQMTTQLQAQMDDQGTVQSDAGEAAEMLGVAKAIWDDLPVTAILLLFVFYFLGGYLLYSSLFAATGAAVDSETDTQQFMLPITIPMIIAIVIAQTAVYNPDGPAVFWFSIIPFTSPVVMMVRIATGNAFAHPAELALSMALLIATFLFTTWLAGRIYRTGILMYGKKVTWKELGKWLFYKG
ncbi:MAG TPA: ABC transporter permease [Flavobacteriales bacterium]|nr:ABC transporter permease [Flavobacteriales bacterium]HRP82481.1 ABC transporter permease [Flavobacteriales bacterium]HRQ84075.1 ABC transporter permease [Flavobacteriales bacterium]